MNQPHEHLRTRRATAGRAVLALVAALACLVAVSPAWGRATIHVRPGQSIQQAIDAATPGDTIVVHRGTYRENLTITTDHLTLKGFRVRLVPGNTPTPSPCTEGTEVNGICAAGEVDESTGSPGDPVEGTTITGFHISGFSGFGVVLFNAADTTVARVEADHNAGYGISGFLLSGVVFRGNSAHDNGEPGFYVGDSPEANAVIVGNRAFGNGEYGFFLRDSSHGIVRGNVAFGNCVGIAFLETGEPTPVADWRAEGNVSSRNSMACPPPDEGGPPLSGTGILVAGGTDIHVVHNVVRRNVPGVEAPFAGGIVVVSSADFGGGAPTDIAVRKNVAFGNNPADLVWDETGSVSFDRNRCGTSSPAGLCATHDQHHGNQNQSNGDNHDNAEHHDNGIDDD